MLVLAASASACGPVDYAYDLHVDGTSYQPICHSVDQSALGSTAAFETNDDRILAVRSIRGLAIDRAIAVQSRSLCGTTSTLRWDLAPALGLSDAAVERIERSVAP